MRLHISFFALFVAVALLQTSSGAISPLDALGGLASGFSRAQVGLLGSAHFLGFFIGCWWAPRLIGDIGHSRAFAAFAACGAIGTIAHPIWMEPYPWAVMRVMTGLCIAGCYTVIEAWFNSEVTNATRGRVLGTYRLVDLSFSMVAQLLIGFLEPATYLSYNLLAILCVACLFPLTLTQATPPAAAAMPRLRPIKAFRLSPLGVVGVVVAGVTTASFRMVGPVYGQEVGLATEQIAYFLAAFVLGGALAQLPAGWAADRFDRRWVLIVVSVFAIVASVVTVLYGTSSQWSVFFCALLFGAASFPVFSLASAHANDFADKRFMVELSASLMFWYGIGAIASPLLSSVLIEHFGPSALFVFISVAHALLAMVGLVRMLSRPTADTKTPYRYIPRTSFVLGRLLKKRSK
ncbi:MAG: MFS transporter [Granulosicoccaceae bacterium]